MKRILLFCALALLMFTSNAFAASSIVAFPGAEGYGKYATGGRMTSDTVPSMVYYVTSLADCADGAEVEGTLRWALHTGTDAPRTILFKVGGTIKLTSKLKFTHPNVSILGQSAPGGGICISGYDIYLCKSNVIMRYIRFRVGDSFKTSISALDVENAHNIILDHCTFSWSMEENVTMYDNDSTTMQWCIVSEPLYSSYNSKGARAYAGQWGGQHSSYHHNLIASCMKRTPRVNGVRTSSTSGHDLYVESEIMNNVMFNCAGEKMLYGGELEAPNVADAYCKTYLVNNYFKPSLTTKAKSGTNGKRYFANIIHESAATGFEKWFVRGNHCEPNQYTTSDVTAINRDNWYNVNNTLGGIIITSIPSDADYTAFKMDTMTNFSGIDTTSADSAYKDVVAKVGARLPAVDEVDGRVIAEAAGLQSPQYHGTYAPSYVGVIDSQDNLKPTNADSTWNAWPDLSKFSDETVLTDTDGDGMPDTYEDANGFNKSDASDGMAIAANGYSNLENYMNSLIEKAVNAPYNLVAKVNSDSTAIVLSWIDASSNETNFLLYRATVGGDTTFTNIATLDANVTNYTDTTSNIETKYIYRLCAINTSAQSGYARTVYYPIVKNSASVKNAQVVNGLIVYPNPVKTLLNVVAAENIQSLILYDLTGKVLMKQNVDAVETTMNMEGLSSGSYLLNIVAKDGNMTTMKIIK